MSFDFFNEGLKPESSIVFSKEENMFLEAKLPFLDPKKTGSIALGNALQFIKFSGLRSQIYQKILKNCKIQAGTKQLTYDQMKKIFRGIALAQNSIEPSTININANIKTKLPIFQEDDSEEDEQPPQQTQAKPQRQNTTPEKQQKVPSKSKPEKPPQQPVPTKQIAKPPTPPASKGNKQNQSNQQAVPALVQGDQFSNKLKEFQAYWSKLPTNNNKIDGGQVKSLCKNLAQRSNLSKAWKICCLTQAGSLTKGEFFVFLQMVGSNKLPQTLTPELKLIIAQIDKGAQLKPKQKEVVPVRDFSQIGATQLFENFGKSDPILPVQDSKNSSSAIRESSIFPSVQQTATKIQKSLQKVRTSVSAAKQSTDNEVNNLRRGQQILNNMMGEIEHFFTQVNSKNQDVRVQIDELKNNQNVLNDRLGKVCVALNGIIVQQNSLIEQLMQEVHTQNLLNQQRVAVLQNYVAETNAQLQAKQREIQVLKNAQKQPHNQFKPKNNFFQQRVESEHQKEPEQQQQENQYKSDDQNHPKSQEQQQKEEGRHTHQQSLNPTVIHQQTAPSSQSDKNVAVNRQSIQPTQAQIQQQRNDYIARMKIKQMKVIALINYLTPISAVEYPQIAQRITSYSEENLDVAFLGLKQKVEEKQRADQLEMQRQQQLQRASINSQVDDFNTNKFHEEDKQSPNQDFFK